MGVSLKDIAEDTGLSIVTVSKYLNGKKILEKNRLLIEDSIRRLNYIPNINARMLQNNRTNIVAFVCSAQISPFWGEMIDYIQKDLRMAGYVPMLIFYYSDRDSIEKVNSYLKLNLAGAIILTGYSHGHLAHLFRERNIPVVCMDQQQDTSTDLVTNSNFEAGYLAASHLLAKGHEYIGCVCADIDVLTMRDRYLGFKSALKDFGCYHGEKYFTFGKFSLNAGHDDVDELLSRRIKPTAIASLSDDYALGIIERLSERGFVIGEDISYIAIDDNIIYRSMKHPVSVIVQNKFRMAQVAVSLLMRRMNSLDLDDIGLTMMVSPKVIIRESVVAPERGRRCRAR